MNTIQINFIACDPAPANGYNVLWRVSGSGGAYTDAGNFALSPAIFTDGTNPDGTQYEGIVRSDCSESGVDSFGNNIPWNTATGTYAIALVGACTGINSNYTVSGGTPGDVVTVRAYFSGQIQKISNNFTRADLDISSPDGTVGSNASTCYADTGAHGFSITADTVITMLGSTATVTLGAVVHNSSETITSVSVVIVDINGSPVNISTIGCRGNSSTGGVC